jgi:hypothetical protein
MQFKTVSREHSNFELSSITIFKNFQLHLMRILKNNYSRLQVSCKNATFKKILHMIIIFFKYLTIAIASPQSLM